MERYYSDFTYALPPPYYTVVFSSYRTSIDNGYDNTAQLMINLAKEQKKFLGMETCHNDIGITISYWENLDAIQSWKENLQHKEAQKRGKEK